MAGGVGPDLIATSDGQGADVFVVGGGEDAFAEQLVAEGGGGVLDVFRRVGEVVVEGSGVAGAGPVDAGGAEAGVMGDVEEGGDGDELGFVFLAVDFDG